MLAFGKKREKGIRPRRGLKKKRGKNFDQYTRKKQIRFCALKSRRIEKQNDLARKGKKRKVGGVERPASRSRFQNRQRKTIKGQ